MQAVLSPASPQAAAIAHLARLFFAGAALVWLIVLGFLALSLLRPRGLGTHDHDAGLTRRQWGGVATALVLSVVGLLGLGVADYRTSQRITSAPPPNTAGKVADTLQVRLIGHQWWWEVQYEQPSPPYRVTTANELHIPVGRPVRLTLESGDVIHSFWAPNLHGKTDLIPSYKTGLSIQADKPGIFHAPCAEYCGHQHAKMTLLVVAQPPDSFAAWYANETRTAAEPATPSAQAGRDVFLQSACAFCHTIRGTPSGGTVAPDLTHLAARRMIGAGAVANQRTELAAWVMNPQGIKPGNYMPANAVAASDLNALLDYLLSLR